jgi:hypothetical protein
MNSQLNAIVAENHRSDLLAAAARSRHVAERAPSARSTRRSRVWRRLRPATT